MKKRTYKVLSLITFILGLILIMSPNLTGAFIGASEISSIINNLIGTSLIIISGIVFMVSERGLEDLVDPKDFKERIKKHNPDVIILDTSAILSYQPKEIETILKECDNVRVPSSVLREIKDPYARRIIEKYGHRVENINRWYKKLARKYLEMGDKATYYKEVKPVITGVKQPEQKKSGGYARKAKKLLDYLKEDGLPPTKENLLKMLDRHYKVSETDVEVLASALYEARHNCKHVVVGEKDRDLRDAIKEIKKKNPKIKGFIDYAEPYSR